MVTTLKLLHYGKNGGKSLVITLKLLISFVAEFSLFYHTQSEHFFGFAKSFTLFLAEVLIFRNGRITSTVNICDCSVISGPCTMLL